MPTVNVTVLATGKLRVSLLAQGEEPAEETPAEGETTTEEPLEEGPSPIAPEGKELVWGVGAFIVFLLLVRLVLYPRVKKGMDARYNMVRDELESADALRAGAEAEVAEYEAELAAVRAEAAKRLDTARQALEAERQPKLAEVNARIAERRAAAATEAEEVKARAREQVLTAAADVAVVATERVLGLRVDAAAARSAVDASLSAGVQS